MDNFCPCLKERPKTLKLNVQVDKLLFFFCKKSNRKIVVIVELLSRYFLSLRETNPKTHAREC